MSEYLLETGEFLEDINPNSTLNLRVDCGSHCKEYGSEPGSGEDGSVPFCKYTSIEQPNKRKGCPLEKGGVILSYDALVFDLFFHTPVSHPP